MNWDSVYVKYQYDQILTEAKEEEEKEQYQIANNYLKFKKANSNTGQEALSEVTSFQGIDQYNKKEKGDFSMIVDSINQYVNNEDKNIGYPYQDHNESYQFFGKFSNKNNIFSLLTTKQQKKEVIQRNQMILNEDLNLVKKESDVLILNYCLLFEYDPQKDRTLNRNQIVYQDKKDYCEQMIDQLVLDQMKKIKMELRRYLQGSQINESYRSQKFESIRELDFKILYMKFTQAGFTVSIVTKLKLDLYTGTPQLSKENLIMFLNKKKQILFTGTVLLSEQYKEKQNKNHEVFQWLDETLFEENGDNIAQAVNIYPEENNIENNKNQPSDKQEFFSSIKLNINQTNAIEVLQQLLDPKDLVIFEVSNRWKPFKCNFLALKYMLDDPNDVSFANEIIKGQNQGLYFDQFNTHISKYFQNNPNYNFFQNIDKKQYFNCLLKLIDELKNSKTLSLTQIDCMKYMLTQKIALVQSIQGIQKCQIQFETVKMLLQTYSKQKNKKPILIICHQNETLNKYLEYLSKIENKQDSNDQEKQKEKQISILRLGNVGKENYKRYQQHLLPNELRNPLQNSKVDQLNKQWSQQVKYYKMANRKLEIEELTLFQADFNEKAKAEQFQKIDFQNKITNLLISQYFADFSQEDKEKILQKKKNIFSLWINLNLSSNELENVIQIKLSNGQKKLIDYQLGLIIIQRNQYNKLFQSTSLRFYEMNPIIFNLQEQQLDNSPQSFAKFINGFERLSQITFYYMMSIQDYIIYFYRFQIYENLKKMNSIFNQERENNAKKQTVQQYEHFLQQDVILTTVNYSHTYSLVFKILQPEIVIIDEADIIQNEYQIANVLFYQPKHLIQFGGILQLNLRDKKKVLKVKNQNMKTQFLRLIRTKIPIYKTILLLSVTLDLYLLVNLITNKDLVDDEGEIQQSFQRLQDELNDSQLQQNKKYCIYVNNFDIQQQQIVIINIKKNQFKHINWLLKKKNFLFYHNLKENKININIQNIYLYQQIQSDYVFIVCNRKSKRQVQNDQRYFKYSFQNSSVINVTGANFRFFNQLEILAQITYQFHEEVVKKDINQVRLQLNPFYYLLDYDKINEYDLQITRYDQEILVENFLKKYQKLIQENTESQRSLQVPPNQQDLSGNLNQNLSISSSFESQNQLSQTNSEQSQENPLGPDRNSNDIYLGKKKKIIYVKKSKNIFDALNQSQLLEEKYENQQVFNKTIKNIILLISKRQTDLTKVLFKIQKYLRKLINYMDDDDKIDYYEERMDQIIFKLIVNYFDMGLFYESLKDTAVFQNDKIYFKAFVFLQQDILIKQFKFKIRQNNNVNQQQNYILDIESDYHIKNLISLLQKKIFKNNQKLIQKFDLIKKYTNQILDIEWILIQILVKETRNSQNKEVQMIGQINNIVKNFKFKISYKKSNISFSEFQFQFQQENDIETQQQQVQELNQILIEALQQQFKSYIIILAKSQNGWILKKIKIEKDHTQQFEEECSNIFIFVKQKIKDQKKNNLQQINQAKDIEHNLSSKLLNSINTIYQIYNQ
ncbi:hypothetical protein ABPG72_017486 [Tetrahymena utriculariae]